MSVLNLNLWTVARLIESGGVQIGRDITERIEPGTVPMTMGIAGGFFLVAFLLAALVAAVRKS